MARTQFEELKVYQLAEQLADAIWTIAKNWPVFVRNTLGNQLVRAGDSIGANIAEGAGRGSFQDNRRFIRIARGSLNETQHWLRRAFKRGLLQPDEITRLKTLIDELGPRLNAYLKSIGPGNSRRTDSESTGIPSN
ncbi:MAG: ribosomal protein [Planctomycetaceae bacterium]|nr:ribosomal protein [Planctomycetaceae bacterium]